MLCLHAFIGARTYVHAFPSTFGLYHTFMLAVVCFLHVVVHRSSSTPFGRMPVGRYMFYACCYCPCCRAVYVCFCSYVRTHAQEAHQLASNNCSVHIFCHRERLTLARLIAILTCKSFFVSPVLLSVASLTIESNYLRY